MRYGSVQNAEIHLFCSENRNFLKKRQSIDPGKPMLLCGSRNVSSLPTYHTHFVFSFTTHRSSFTILIPTKTGRTKIRAMMEKSSPPHDPTAKENQKGSSCPSIRNGTSPNMLEMTVRERLFYMNDGLF